MHAQAQDVRHHVACLNSSLDFPLRGVATRQVDVEQEPTQAYLELLEVLGEELGQVLGRLAVALLVCTGMATSSVLDVNDKLQPHHNIYTYQCSTEQQLT